MDEPDYHALVRANAGFLALPIERCTESANIYGGLLAGPAAVLQKFLARR
ncbi:hypothetical protein [Lichenicoccus sp.]